MDEKKEVPKLIVDGKLGDKYQNFIHKSVVFNIVVNLQIFDQLQQSDHR